MIRLISILLALTAVPAFAGNEVGSGDNILRVPHAGGRAVFGSIDLSKSNAVGSSILAGANGGSGIANSGTFTWGSNNITITTSGTTGITIPTSGTMATLAGTETFTNHTINGLTLNINTTAKTGAYNVSATDDVVQGDASGGTFSLTLPTASGIAGKVYTLEKIDSSTTIITIATTSSQTIDGVTTTTLATQYESVKVMSNGSNWIILQRRYPQQWISFTPTGAWSSNTTYTGFYRRVGDSIEVYSKVALSGATTNANLTFNIPNNSTWTIDTAKPSSTFSTTLGTMGGTTNSGGNSIIGQVGYNNTTSVGVQWTTSNGASPNPVGSITLSNSSPGTMGNTDTVSIHYVVPITNFK